MSEAEILNAIMLEFGSLPYLRIWRVNTVKAMSKTGRMIQSVPIGSSDISGIVLPLGRRLEMEVKSSTGRVSAEQFAYIDMIKSMGGIAGVVRSVDDARLLIESARK